MLIVEIQACDAVVALGVLGLLLDRDSTAILVELNDTKALGVVDLIAKNRSPLCARGSVLEHLLEAMPKEDVVAQNKRTRIAVDKLLAEDKGLCKAIWRRLNLVGKVKTKHRAIAKEALEVGKINWRRDDQDIADTSHHKNRERVVDHRLVVDRKKLL